ncbi:hypothetical protein BS47DRAFT_1263962, partial [Hydnum rufescens UP504]
QLACGICAFDVTSNDGFDLHVYPLSVNGDMQAIKHVTCLKGHNALCPCCACKIWAVHDAQKGCSTYYVPLHQPNGNNVELSSWDPHELPYHTEERHQAQLQAIYAKPQVGHCKTLGQEYGINGESDVCKIPSICLFSSFPHEWMHLFLENHCKNMIKLWTGTFK